MSVYGPECHSVGVGFISLVAESLGGWSDRASSTITTTRTESRLHPGSQFHALFNIKGNANIWTLSSPQSLMGLVDFVLFSFSPFLCGSVCC